MSKISLSEAIEHAREVAEEQKRRSGACTTNDNECDKFSKCLECAEEHEQLAEWLEELKELREMVKYNAFTDGYNKAISDCSEIVSKLPDMCVRSCPIGCDYGTEQSCKESWKIYLTEQTKSKFENHKKE